MTTDTYTTDISNSADMIDVRDVIARVEELEGELTKEIEGNDQLDDDGKVIEDTVTCGTWNTKASPTGIANAGGRLTIPARRGERRKDSPFETDRNYQESTGD